MIVELSGQLNNAQGAPVVEPFSITLFNLGVVQADNQVYLGNTWSVFPDLMGSFTVNLWANLESDNASYYQVEHPNGVTYQLAVPGGISSGNYADYIKLDDLKQEPGLLSRVKILESSSGVTLLPRIDSLEVDQITQNQSISTNQAKVSQLETTVNSHQVAIDSVQTISSGLTQAQSDIVGLGNSITTAQANISQNSSNIANIQSGIGNKADQSDLDLISDQVAELSVLPTAVSGNTSLMATLLADVQSVTSSVQPLVGLDVGFSDLSSRVGSNEGQIASNAVDISSKANLSSLNTLQTAFDSHLHTGTVWSTSQIPDLSASKITSGTLALGRLPVLPISQTTGLQTALNGKSSVSHNHTNWSELPSSNPPLSSPTVVTGNTSSQIILQLTAQGYPDYRLIASNNVVALQADDDSDGSYDDFKVFRLDRDIELAEAFGHELWHSGNTPIQEGSFTPYPLGTGWGYTSSGSYYKQGKLVLIYTSFVSVTTVGSGATVLLVEGLPFNSSGNCWISLRINELQNMPSNFTFAGHVTGNRFVPTYSHGSNSRNSQILLSQVKSGTIVYISGVYFTND